MKRIALVVLCVLGCATGCTYLGNRWKDALDMVDLGFTFTRKPQFGIYANCPFLAPAGYAKVDGKYVGLGGGKFGITEHHQDAASFVLYGRERFSWSKPGGDTPSQAPARTVRPLGIATNNDGKVTYNPQCAHYLHLAYVGVTANLNYKEWADFFLGWIGFDISRDDNRWRRRPARPHTATTRPTRTRPGPLLVARTDRSTFAPGQPVVVTVRLINHTGRARTRNKAGAALIVPRPRPGKGRSRAWFSCLVFEAQEMRLCSSQRLAFAAGATPGPNDRVRLLRPGASAVFQLLYDPSPAAGLQPGRYALVVLYKAQSPDASLWTGTACSNGVLFQVSLGPAPDVVSRPCQLPQLSP